jgi:hypothetical protein
MHYVACGTGLVEHVCSEETNVGGNNILLNYIIASIYFEKLLKCVFLE